MNDWFSAPSAVNYRGLVTAEWLRAALAHRTGEGTAPAEMAGGPLVVVEVSWSKGESPAEYLAGHVPGSVHLDTDLLEDGYPTWRLRPLVELRAVIGGLGVDAETTVVVYSHQAIAAARAWWVLMYAGVRDVRILDGGYEAWLAAGLPGETTPRTPRPVRFAAEARHRWLATSVDVEAVVASGDSWLLDVRSEREYRGEVSGYDYLDATGRIAGALHGGDGDAGGPYVGPDGRFRDPGQVSAMWRSAGITGNDGRFDREVVVYCGSGWRSSAAFFHAWLLGYTNIRNYSDGWCYWSTEYIPDPSAKGTTPGWRQVRRRAD